MQEREKRREKDKRGEGRGGLVARPLFSSISVPTLPEVCTRSTSTPKIARALYASSLIKFEFSITVPMELKLG